jgi:hypothetical protein
MAEVTLITEWYFLCKALKNSKNSGLHHAPIAG